MIACMSTFRTSPTLEKNLCSILCWTRSACALIGLMSDSRLNEHYQTAVDKLFPMPVESSAARKIFTRPSCAQSNIYLILRELIQSRQAMQMIPSVTNKRLLKVALIKKYQHRALLITNSTCPIHCRYCFRKDYPYSQHTPQRHRFDAALRTNKRG